MKTEHERHGGHALVAAALAAAVGVAAVAAGPGRRVRAVVVDTETPRWGIAGEPYELVGCGPDGGGVIERGRNEQNEEGVTVLMLTAEDDNVPAIEFLRAAGASLSLRDRNGHTALDHARKYDNCRHAVEALRRAGAR